MVVGAIYAWRLAWIAWQALPGNPSGATENGVAHV